MRPQRGYLPLGGMDRAKATLPGEDGPQPDEVFNLRPHRAGGLMPIGNGTPLGSTYSAHEWVAGDESGLLSYSLTGHFGLLRGVESLGHQPHRAGVTFPEDSFLHIPRLGMQMNSEEYMYVTNDGDLVIGDWNPQPRISITFEPDVNGTFSAEAEYNFLGITTIPVAAGMRVVHTAHTFSYHLHSNIEPPRMEVIYKVENLPPNARVDIYFSRRLDRDGEGLEGHQPWRLVRQVHQDTTDVFDGTETGGAGPSTHGSVYPTQSGFGFWLVSHRVSAAIHNQRVWSVRNAVKYDKWTETNAVAYHRQPVEPDPYDASSPLTIQYTEQGYVNMADPGSTLVIPARGSEKITALLPSSSNEFGVFGGLLVFCDNETFVVLGDPAVPDTLEVRPHLMDIGCDEGIAPVQVGGRTFIVWRGRLYMMLGGAQVQEVSQPIIRPGEAFTRLVADAGNQAVLVKLGNNWYRYYYTHDFWTIDPISSRGTGFAWGGSHADGPFYLNHTTGEVFNVQPSSSPPTPYVKWLDVDFGDPAMVKKLFSARSFLTDYRTQAGQDIIWLRYNLYTDPPTVEFGPRLQASVSGQDAIFRFPPRERGKRLDFLLQLPYALERTVLESPVEVTFTPGYRKR